MGARWVQPVRPYYHADFYGTSVRGVVATSAQEAHVGVHPCRRRTEDGGVAGLHIEVARRGFALGARDDRLHRCNSDIVVVATIAAAAATAASTVAVERSVIGNVLRLTSSLACLCKITHDSATPRVC